MRTDAPTRQTPHGQVLVVLERRRLHPDDLCLVVEPPHLQLHLQPRVFLRFLDLLFSEDGALQRFQPVASQKPNRNTLDTS